MGFRKSSPGCGPFQFEIRAWDLTKDDTRDIAEHFGENRSHVRAAIASQQGVSIYRADILVLPKSAGARDWLGLDLRRVSRLGSRLSTSQVLGCVRITKAGNPRIVDTSDREGLVSNTEMLAFRYLVRRIVGLLEQQRHIDRMDSKDTGTASELFANINAEPLVAKLEMLRDSGGDVSAAVEAAKDFGNELDRSRAVIERRFGYYNRLAVIGTIAQIVIHEIRNRTTVIGRGLRKGKELAERVGDEIRGRALAIAKGVGAVVGRPCGSFRSAREPRLPRRPPFINSGGVNRALPHHAGSGNTFESRVGGVADEFTYDGADRPRGDRHDHSQSGHQLAVLDAAAGR